MNSFALTLFRTHSSPLRLAIQKLQLMDSYSYESVEEREVQKDFRNCCKAFTYALKSNSEETKEHLPSKRMSRNVLILNRKKI